MSAVVINGGLVHYESFGRGTPILFLHGWLGSWRYWMQTMESLSTAHRVYALDLWGFGDSDKSEKRFNIDHYVRMIATFIEELGVVNPVIVGHALGAGVALEYACRTASPVNKIMAISLPLSAEAIDRRLVNYASPSVLSKVFRWKPIPNEEVEEEANRAAELVIPSSLDSFANLNVLDRLENVECEVLIVYGEKDEVVDPTPFRSLENSLTHVKHISLPDSRHFPMIDDVAKFIRLLKDFSDRSMTLDSIALKEEWRRRTR